MTAKESDDLRDRLLAKLDEWIALAEKATPGPWWIRAGCVVPASDADEDGVVVCVPRNANDTRFVSLSRTAGPAAWRALRAEASEHQPEWEACCVACADEEPWPCPRLLRIAKEILEEES